MRLHHVGDQGYKTSDLVYYLKRCCQRAGVSWYDDVFNELAEG